MDKWSMLFFIVREEMNLQRGGVWKACVPYYNNDDETACGGAPYGVEIVESLEEVDMSDPSPKGPLFESYKRGHFEPLPSMARGSGCDSTSTIGRLRPIAAINHNSHAEWRDGLGLEYICKRNLQASTSCSKDYLKVANMHFIFTQA
eukprot:scaffold187962_cov55-Attheya_sp.AAC.2